MKKETLEDYIERGTEGLIEPNVKALAKSYLRYGAQWQAENMYTEDDVKKAFKAGFSNGFASDVLSTEKLQKEKERLFCKWFKQNKKK
jgi:hypothetical protein